MRILLLNMSTVYPLAENRNILTTRNQLICSLLIQLMLASSVLAVDVKTLQQSAEAGEAEAQYQLAVLYDDGGEVAQNYEQAIYWYQKAAEQGLDKAQHNLGIAYDEGLGVTQDYQQAYEWFQKAAQQGFSLSQFSLGIMYAFGQGRLADAKRAYMWLKIARNNGYPEAARYIRLIVRGMSQEQRSEAEALVSRCEASNFKDC